MLAPLQNVRAIYKIMTDAFRQGYPTWASNDRVEIAIGRRGSVLCPFADGLFQLKAVAFPVLRLLGGVPVAMPEREPRDEWRVYTDRDIYITALFDLVQPTSDAGPLFKKTCIH